MTNSDYVFFFSQVKESWLDVNLCQEGSRGCEVSNSTSQAGVLKFPKRSSEETVNMISTLDFGSI